MAYASWSVVFGEQPTASKWNILGENDAFFNDTITGTGTLSSKALTNPYKFRVYRNTSTQTVASGFVKIQFNAESYDTGSNFDSSTNYRFTAPIAGFYLFSAAANLSTSTNDDYTIALYKNGSIVSNGSFLHASTGTTQLDPNVCDILQLAANDYIEVFAYTTNGGGQGIANGSEKTYFAGCLISAT